MTMNKFFNYLKGVHEDEMLIKCIWAYAGLSYALGLGIGKEYGDSQAVGNKCRAWYALPYFLIIKKRLEILSNRFLFVIIICLYFASMLN